MLSIGCWGSVFVLVLLCITLCPFLFCNHLEEEERELVALLLLSYGCFVYCKCSVTLPHGAVGCSRVCDCGIS